MHLSPTLYLNYGDMPFNHLTSLAETIAAVTIHSHIHPCVIQNVSSLFRIVAFVHSAVTRTNSLTYTHYILYIALQIINYVTSFLDDLRHTIYEWTSYIMCVQWVASFILLPQLRPARIVSSGIVLLCVCARKSFEAIIKLHRVRCWLDGDHTVYSCYSSPPIV